MGWRDLRARLATRSGKGEVTVRGPEPGQNRSVAGLGEEGAPAGQLVGSVVGCWFQNVRPGWGGVGSGWLPKS